MFPGDFIMQTYKAILEGNSIKWLAESPVQTEATEVLVTVLSEPRKVSDRQAMVLALRRLSRSGQASSFGDPLEWQKETRKDRDLPRREEE
jgi:hypothetical protein